MKRILLFLLPLFIILSCNQESDPEITTDEFSGAFAVSLKNDFAKDGFVIYLFDDERQTRSSSSFPVFFYSQGESVDVLYYNPSAEEANDDFFKDGVIAFHYKTEGEWAFRVQDYRLIFKEINSNEYNVAIIDAEGNKSYLYGLVLDSEVEEQGSSKTFTKISGEDIWHLSYSAILKFTSFAITVLSANPAGVISTMLTEAMKSDFFDMKTRIGEDGIRRLEKIAELTSLFKKDFLGVLASEINSMADNELAKVGQVKEVIKPELGDEWNIRINPLFLRCPNVDAKYTVEVSSKALWKVNDSHVDKSWCSVEKSGENRLIVTVKQNPEPGVHSCYATIVQAVESTIYTIAPKNISIELFSDVQFSLSPSELVFGKNGGSKPVLVNKSDNIIGWSVDKHPKWCTIDRGAAQYSFWVDVPPSETGHEAEPIIVYGAVDEYTFCLAEVMVSQIVDDESLLRQKLIQFYNDTGGPTTWIYRDNWCSDKPLQEWYGIYYDEQGFMTLDLHGNNLTQGGSLEGIDVLKSVDVGSSWGINSLEYLSISGCRSLEKLDCHGNQLVTLDASGCTSLVDLGCTSNQLTSINIDGCSSLTRLWCTYNKMTYLSVSGFSNLVELNCEDNQLTSLDVSGCTSLERIACGQNQLSSLNITGLNHLLSIGCSPNPITDLNVTNCKSLTKVGVGGDSLKRVNVSGCTSLSRIYVTTDWWYFACNPDDDSIGFMGEVLESFDVSGCTALEYFHICCPTFTSVNVSGCTSLKGLSISGTQITSLDASNLPNLMELNCTSNMLTSLNVSGCPSLGLIDCFNNELSSIDVSGCPSLYRLWCNNNHINQEITHEDKLSTFFYDIKYEYIKRWDDSIGEYRTEVIKHPYGWWYPGEPEKGYHGR